MTDKPIALDAYEALAEAYAALVDTKPHNAYCERPATLSLLPEVGGKRVLDAGCGPGVYSSLLIKRGAEVVALDASAKMVELAKQRLGRDVDIRQADLRKPLGFLGNASFDVVLSPLVMDYVEDWTGPLSEFYRVLRPGGHFIFSVAHPLFDYLYFNSNNYYESAIFNSVTEAGFSVERIIEPKPTDKFREADPKDYEKLSRQPCFLCVRTKKVKPAIEGSHL